MRIFGISVVKNEADIIQYSLEKSSQWADKIFVVDNGSEDNTWEIVQEVAKHNRKVIPWKQTNELFTDGMRADVFNHFKHEAKSGDWWCHRLDADEFYIDDPRFFLSTRVKKYYHTVCSRHIQYRITDLDVIPAPIAAEELVNTLNYYEPRAHSEIRFFRHRDRLEWDRKDGFPRLAGLVSPERILLRHYQYRSYQQIQTRIRLRYSLEIFPHVKENDWKKYILKTTDCIYDRRILQDYLDLPISNNANLKYRWWVFWLKRFLYSTGIWP